MRSSHGWSRAPIVEMLIPSVVDDSLAPRGMHVASLFCQHANPRIGDVLPGRTWDDHRDEVADLMIDTVDAVAPNFRQSVLGRRVLSPLDLEREFGLVGGDIFHGALALDQLFSARPVLGNADYRMPIKGLYLCGSGAHPGGGVTGIPGRNAAREIIKDAQKRTRRRRAVAARAVRAEAATRSAVTRQASRPLQPRADIGKASTRERAKLWPVEIDAKPADKPGSVTARGVARYDRHSSRPAVADGLEPPTRGLGEQRRRPPIWCCSGWRLPRFTRFPLTGSDSSLWPCSSPSPAARAAAYCGRALPGILLCGARTFLSPGIAPEAATVWLASDR